MHAIVTDYGKPGFTAKCRVFFALQIFGKPPCINIAGKSVTVNKFTLTIADWPGFYAVSIIIW